MRSSVVAFLVLSLAACWSAHAADPEAGAKVFRKCQACHAVGEGAENKVGPELNGLFGRPAGSVPGYDYSEANKASGIVWTEDVFAAYIRDPRGYLKGTKMTFAGLRKDQEIADVIAYLKQFKADGSPAD